LLFLGSQPEAVEAIAERWQGAPGSSRSRWVCASWCALAVTRMAALVAAVDDPSGRLQRVRNLLTTSSASDRSRSTPGGSRRT